MVSDPHVPFFSGSTTFARDWEVLATRIRAAAQRGTMTSGPLVAELEEAIKSYTGARFAVACNNASDALIIMLRAAGIGPGDEVIVPSYSFFATASCVVHAGAEPVFVDVLPDTYAMDPAAVRAAVGPRTRAIMVVHLFHQTADLAALRRLADEHGLQFFEDSAEAIGMRVNGRHAGLWGRAGVLSFFPTKTLGALGDAGMVLTDDEEYAQRVRRMTGMGRLTDDEPVTVLGAESACDEIQAAVLLARLAHLDRDIARRAVLARRYSERLAGLPAVRTPVVAGDHAADPVWYVYLLESDRRDELVQFLAERGVGTEVYYPRPLPDQPCLRGLPGSGHPVPVAAAASSRAVGLPLYPDLREDQVDYVCDLIREFHKETP